MEKVFFMKEIFAGPPKNIYQYWKTKLPGLRQFLAVLILALWPKYGLEHHLPSSSRKQISNKAYLHDLNFFANKNNARQAKSLKQSDILLFRGNMGKY